MVDFCLNIAMHILLVGPSERSLLRVIKVTEIDFRRSPALLALKNSNPFDFNHPSDKPSMSARQAFGNIARRRLVAPKPTKGYVKWYMNWADTAHKAVVLTCVGVTRMPPFQFRKLKNQFITESE